MVRIPKTATQVECNSSYFKLSIFEKAEVGCRNLEIESLELYFAKTSNFKFTGKINWLWGSRTVEAQMYVKITVFKI